MICACLNPCIQSELITVVYLQSVVEEMNVEPELRVLTISVQMLSGPLPPVTISADSTVFDLKLRLQSLNSDFSFERQKLTLWINETSNSFEEVQPVVLQNHRTLHSYHITGTTNVVLVMLSRPSKEVNIDVSLQFPDSFQALLENGDLHATAMDVDSIGSHPELLLQLFDENRAISSVRISGHWTQHHLRFCQTLLNLRPDIDLYFVVFGGSDTMMMLRVLEFCRLNRCSSIDLNTKDLDDSGYLSLATALRFMPLLQTLHLGSSLLINNHKWIGVAGCVALATALQSMPSLQTLDFVPKPNWS
jgi:hypothetical protein